MKKAVVSISTILILLLQACGGGSGGGGTDYYPVPDDTKTVYTLSVTSNGSGSVTPSGDMNYDENSVVQLTATPESGWYFDHWEGSLSGSSNPSNITITSNKSVVAVFTQNISLNVTVKGSGTVTPANSTFKKGEKLNLKATPSAGWQFDHWSGDVFSKSTEISVTMDAPKNLNAVFVQPYSFSETPAAVLGESQIKDVLYASYAGIGYMNAQNLTDDEKLYGVMFNDLNTLIGVYFNEVFTKNPLIPVLWMGSANFDYQGSRVSFTSNITKSEGSTMESTFSMTISISGKVSLNGINYYGTGSNDIVVSGVFVNYVDSQIVSRTIRNLEIKTSNSLYATYPAPDNFDVKYKNWKISYSFDNNQVNAYILLPIDKIKQTDINFADLRYYGLKGDFEIDGGHYYFDMNLAHYDMKKLSLPGTVYLALDGKAAVPGMTGYAEIVSPGYAAMEEYLTCNDVNAIINLSGLTGAITRDTSGIWTSGSADIKSATQTINAIFNTDGSVNLGALGSVSNWQDELDILN